MSIVGLILLHEGEKHVFMWGQVKSHNHGMKKGSGTTFITVRLMDDALKDAPGGICIVVQATIEEIAIGYHSAPEPLYFSLQPKMQGQHIQDHPMR